MKKKTNSFEFKQDNKLYQYYFNSNEDITWASIAEKAGMTVQGIMNICMLSKEEIINSIRLKTYLAIKDKLGIDLIN